MLVSNTLLIKTFVTGIMLFCLMSDMLCWFANGEHQHLDIEFYKNERACLKLVTTFLKLDQINESSRWIEMSKAMKAFQTKSSFSNLVKFR